MLLSRGTACYGSFVRIAGLGREGSGESMVPECDVEK